MPFCVPMVRVLVCVKSDKVGKSLVPNCLGGRKRGICIIRKTKRFSIPERAVQYLKTKRTAETPPVRP